MSGWNEMVLGAGWLVPSGWDAPPRWRRSQSGVCAQALTGTAAFQAAAWGMPVRSTLPRSSAQSSQRDSIEAVAEAQCLVARIKDDTDKRRLGDVSRKPFEMAEVAR